VFFVTIEYLTGAKRTGSPGPRPSTPGVAPEGGTGAQENA
jgi:hypothetical protein